MRGNLPKFNLICCLVCNRIFSLKPRSFTAQLNKNAMCVFRVAVFVAQHHCLMSGFSNFSVCHPIYDDEHSMNG